MPFLLPALPAIAAGAGSALAGAGVNALLSGGKNAGGFQGQGFGMGDLTGANNQVQGNIGQQQAFLNALQQQQGGMGAQSFLAGQLMDQSMGGGPNPALAQLANTTGQNTANQAALMAGQRGIGANPGLLARGIGQMGAMNQQQAAGQAAVLRANQQLAAQQALGQLAGQQVGQQQNALGILGNMGFQNQSDILNSINNQNSVNAGIAQGNQANAGKIAGGVAGGIGAGMMSGLAGNQPAPSNFNNEAWQAAIPKASDLRFAKGGQVDSELGSHATYFNSMKEGGRVPGKAKVKGDSLSNDTVPAMLSPGEIVIPRSKVNDPDKAKRFVEAILAKKRGGI